MIHTKGDGKIKHQKTASLSKYKSECLKQEKVITYKTGLASM